MPIALVTGGAKRIGRAIALALSDAGMDIIIHYRSSAHEAEELHDVLSARGTRAWTLHADFAAEDADAVIARALALAGGLDLLVNSAANFPPETLEEVTFGSLTEAMRVDAWEPFALSRAFARQAGRGQVINLLDSRLGDQDWGHIGYMIAKHALYAFTRMTALAYAPAVRVNAVSPGAILPPPGGDMAYLERVGQATPLQMHGDPADVAEAVVFLARSRYITGEVINVDGGRHLKGADDGPYRHS